jgi:hypothetical protein
VRLDFLPAEGFGLLLPPGMEYFIDRFRGELEMPGVSDQEKDHLES